MDYKDTAKELLDNVRQSLLLNDPDLALELLINGLDLADTNGKRKMLDDLRTDK